jgi:hypothetical protein
MISNHDARRPRASEPALTADPVPAPDPEATTCGQGGLEKIVNGNDLVTASAHFRQCTACQREFLGRGGVLPQMGGRSMPTGAQGETRRHGQPPPVHGQIAGS